MCYWYQQTEQNYQKSSMAAEEAAAEALAQRLLDFVAPGEQQSEAGHESKYSSGSTTGLYNGERYRDAQANGYVQYSLYNKKGVRDSLAVMLRFTTADRGRKGTLKVDGTKIADITIPETVKDAENGFYNVEYPIPAALAVDKDGNPKEKFVVRLSASSSTLMPGLYYMRLMSGNKDAVASAIKDVQQADANEPYYTLYGTKAKPSHRGLYIRKGKKFIK